MAGQGITRRTLVGGAAVGAGLAVLPGAARASSGSGARTADVIVVGAGFAGLTAAREVVRRGRSAFVLEARERVGGRSLNHRIPGGDVVDLGAEFVGPTQDRINALIGELHIPTFPTYDKGDAVYYAGGSRTTYSDTGPTGTAPPDPLILADLTLVVTRLDQMATQVPVDAPYAAPNAAQYDRQTLETWLRENSDGSPRFLKLTSTATRAIFGAEPRDISLLFTLFYIAASGDERQQGTFERNFNTRGGAQMTRIDGGTQSIAIKLARQLGRRVLLGAPVRRIVQSGSGVEVISDRLTVRGQRVIVALPPTLAGRIAYEPQLPPLRDGLMQRIPQGYLIKVQATYRRPFWRDDGLSGSAVSDTGPCNVTFDSSPASGKPGALLGFVGGDAARAFAAQSPSARRRAALQSFARYFGPQALDPISYVEQNWAAELYSRGCPVGVLPPGTLLEYGRALRAPVGRIHWAGTETSTYWNGYMDGAVRSGQRAAAEALADLGPRRASARPPRQARTPASREAPGTSRARRAHVPRGGVQAGDGGASRRP